jgi:hypothetical protein
MKDDNMGSWAQVLTSCRRLLKSLADALYPPQTITQLGIDGNEHNVGENDYLSRLWQFIFEKLSASRSGELLETQVKEIGNRLDRLHNLSHKGVPAEVSRFEVNQAIIQTYLIIGDILRIADDVSVIQSDDFQGAG